MKLSELKPGEKAVIVKVLGHGGFRKRIIEMGFIKGNSIEMLLTAPLHDPVKYKIMGYEVSLRYSEAQLIEVLSEQEANEIMANTDDYTSSFERENKIVSDKLLHNAATKKQKTINIALIGNPNCGKTSLFNFASGANERVGNYSGVTIDAKIGYTEYEGYRFNITDLPGTYSLSAYSPEELYVRKQLIENTPDVIINVIDSSNLERNLYLTTQLIDMNIRMVCALNMYDETQKRGDNINYNDVSLLFGVPMLPTVFKSGKGVENLFKAVINTYEENKDTYRHIHINHGIYIERSIQALQIEIQKNQDIRNLYSTRFLSIKLLEQDKEVEKVIKTLSNANSILETRDIEAKKIKEDTKEDSETNVMNAKYAFIHGALQETMYKQGDKNDVYIATQAIDKIITNKYLGFPMFLLLIYLMFQVTFTLGSYPMDWIESGIGILGEWLGRTMSEGPLKAMIIDGIIGGVGAVIVFLPQILILYAFISFMEDTGYMARAAFIMDKLMHKMGLHGKSFIPLIMGFGCNVPAIMATRTIESKRSRLITILILPMMSCSARLPIYIMIVSTFFSIQYRTPIIMSFYVIGILFAIIISRILSSFVFKEKDIPFVMELPPYRMPTLKATFRHTWEKGKQYLKKMGGIILVASIVIWALGYFPKNDKLSAQQQQEQSYIGQLGKTIEPIFYLQGFDWKLDVGLLSGLGAKEIVASTLGVLYANNADDMENAEQHDGTHNTELYKKMTADGVTPLKAYSFLLFVLLYFPCIATVAAVKNESGSWKWAMFSVAYTTGLAWIVSALFYQIGQLFY